MGVVPTNVLSKDSVQEEATDFEDLTFSRMIQRSHKYVTHDKVDQSDEWRSGTWKEKGEYNDFISTNDYNNYQIL